MKLKQCSDTLMFKKTQNLNHETTLIEKRKKPYVFDLIFQISQCQQQL